MRTRITSIMIGRSRMLLLRVLSLLSIFAVAILFADKLPWDVIVKKTNRDIHSPRTDVLRTSSQISVDVNNNSNTNVTQNIEASLNGIADSHVQSIIWIDEPKISSDIYYEFTDFDQGCEIQYVKFNHLYPNWSQYDGSSHTSSSISTLVNRIASHNYDVTVNSVVTPQYHHGVNYSIFYSESKYSQLHILKLTILEEVRKRPSEGGSSFRVLSYSNTIRHCGYRDYFNGTYTVYCVMSGKSTDIVIQLSHIDYNAYRGQSRSHDEVIWKKKICFMEATISHVNQYGPSKVTAGKLNQTIYTHNFDKSIAQFHSQVSYHGLWHGNEKNHSFVTNEGYTLPLLSKFMCDCFNQ